MKTGCYAFVLMPFSSAFDDLYQQVIKSACESASVRCERVDEQIFVTSILERIYQKIRDADIIIADITERDANVLYETGYARALGKPVVLLSRSVEDVPFYLASYRHVIYGGDLVNLRATLTKILQGVTQTLDAERSRPDEGLINQYERELVQLKSKDANLLQQIKELVGRYDYKELRFDVFLSHSAADYEDVGKLYEHLKGNGLKVYLARKEIAGGDDFGEEIRLALIHSRELWLLMTPNSLKSEWVTTEWGAGWVLKKRIVPILLRCSMDELPERLRRVQCVDYHDVQRSIARLKEGKAGA
jgi:hypothetical protein